jgi:hypothetical protein
MCHPRVAHKILSITSVGALPEELMERGGIEILPITTKDGRNELLTHSTTWTIPAWLLVLP